MNWKIRPLSINVSKGKIRPPRHFAPLGSVLVHSFILNNRPHCCHHCHHHHTLALGIDNPSIHVIGEWQSCVHKSRIAIWMCDKGKYCCTLNNSVTDFYKRLYTKRPNISSKHILFFSSVRTETLETFLLGKVALTNGRSPSSLLWTLTLKRSFWNCKKRRAAAKWTFPTATMGGPWWNDYFHKLS